MWKTFTFQKFHLYRYSTKREPSKFKPNRIKNGVGYHHSKYWVRRGITNSGSTPVSTSYVSKKCQDCRTRVKLSLLRTFHRIDAVRHTPLKDARPTDAGATKTFPLRFFFSPGQRRGWRVRQRSGHPPPYTWTRTTRAPMLQRCNGASSAHCAPEVRTSAYIFYADLRPHRIFMHVFVRWCIISFLCLYIPNIPWTTMTIGFRFLTNSKYTHTHTQMLVLYPTVCVSALMDGTIKLWKK